MRSPGLQPVQPLRLLVFGAGAIGGYIGGSLALQGHQVVFLEKPEMLARLATHGLRLNIGGVEQSLVETSFDETCFVPHLLLAASLPEALARGPFEAGIFALKSFDTQAALQEMQPFAGRLPPILCLQNGVENEAALAALMGDQQVIPGAVASAIGRRADGEIILEKLRGVGIAGGHALSSRLAQVFSQAGLNARLYPCAADMKWSKMLTNLLANASSAILNLTPAEIFADPALYRLEVAQVREALAVMRAQCIQVVNLPGTPVRLLAWLIRSLPPALSRPLLAGAVGRGRGAKMPSFHIDLHSRRGRSEVDYLNGAVVRFGERSGVPTPVNRLLCGTLLSLARAEIPLEQFAHQPEKLLALWRSSQQQVA